eukprot:Colp12_sorted_trinity150504_noHs@35879
MKMRAATCAFVLVALLGSACADIYMQNMRGSNNRLDEESRERANGNRLFDSQNNDRGGYNVGSLYYIAGSELPLHWTAQHSCGQPNAKCEIIIQYMCGDNLRDGTTTQTIPDRNADCLNNDCNTDVRFGMHEDFDNYFQCKYRYRNAGLFRNTQNLQNTARFTRQNPQATRRGYECPEERDYYPYWMPTPWKDVAILTYNASRCDYYLQESQNTKSRFYCKYDPQVLAAFLNTTDKQNRYSNQGLLALTEDQCTSNKSAIRGNWTEVPAWELPAPVCREVDLSRDNHLGNGIGGYPVGFNWTIPNDPHERCVLRMRYNITTGEYDAWDPNINGSITKPLNLTAKYGATASQNYLLQNNPTVDFGLGIKLRLAINTAQYGRTFQDRSHRFAIRPRPSGVPAGARIANLNVAGKRGNIVQTFPGTEYDFVPQHLHLKNGDYVHIQWTGSETNPENNAGQGKRGTDRHNIVMLGTEKYTKGKGLAAQGMTSFGQYMLTYPSHFDNVTFLGFSVADARALAIHDNRQLGGELSELDDSATYFDLGPRQVTKNGVYTYMCTRNNNFSNRDQKGKVVVSDSAITVDKIGTKGGQVAASMSKVEAADGQLNALTTVSVQEWTPADAKAAANIKSASPVALVQINPPGPVQLKLNLVDSAPNPTVFRGDSLAGPFSAVSNAEFKNGVASVTTQQSGVYYVDPGTNVPVIVGAVIGTVVGIALIVGGVMYMRKDGRMDGCKVKLMSFQSRV